MSAEEQNKCAAQASTEQPIVNLPDDWFWRPVNRHHTEFVHNQESASAWRQLGRTLQIADRLSSQAGGEQTRQAYMYSHTAARKK